MTKKMSCARIVLFEIGLVFVFLALVACSHTALFQKVENRITKNPSRNVKIAAELKDMENESSTINTPNEIYTLCHEKDDTTYDVVITWDIIYPFDDDCTYKYKDNFIMQLYDNNSHQLQAINLECNTFTGIELVDVNSDGYTDAVVGIGGTWNETHELYIWDHSIQGFVKVIFEGFNMLAYFEVYDGYIMNFIRGSSPEDSVMEKLVWNGITLVKEQEDKHDTD